MTTTTYTEVASAPGAWSARLLVPGAPIGTVHTVLADLAAATGTPVTAYVSGGDGDPVDELLLVRDPSRTRGCPAVGEYESLAARLAGESGWRAARDPARRGVLVGMGLREGYEPTAPRHTLDEVERLLAGHGDGWRCRAARLVSARPLDGEVQWYDEVGAVVETGAGTTAALVRMAAAFRQDRFAVTDYEAGRTFVLAAA